MAGQVIVTVTQPQYGRNDAIEASIANGLADDIRAMDHQSGCTLLVMERQVGASWETQNPCLMRSPTRLITLTAGSVTPVRVAPPAEGWAPGAHRVRLDYRFATGDDAMVVASAVFRIV